MPSTRPEVGDRVPDAEVLVALALGTFKSQDWDALVELTDFDSVVTLKARYLAEQRQNRAAREWLQQRDEAMYTLEAREEFARFNEFMGLPHPFVELAGVESLADVEALGTAEFLVRWAQVRHCEYPSDRRQRWHDNGLLERIVVGSVAVHSDCVAVMVRRTNAASNTALGLHSLIPVIANDSGAWLLDATDRWLGLDH